MGLVLAVLWRTALGSSLPHSLIFAARVAHAAAGFDLGEVLAPRRLYKSSWPAVLQRRLSSEPTT